MRTLALSIVVGGLSVGAYAQTFSSFKPAQSLTGVVVTRSGLHFTVSLLAGASFVDASNVSHPIDQLFGFWVMDPKTSPTLGASGVDQSGWRWNSATMGGQIAGWNHNANGGRLTAGQSITLTYSTLDLSQVAGYGYHFQFDGGTKTDFIAPVPEPFSAAALAIGLAGLVRRRRRTR